MFDALGFVSGNDLQKKIESRARKEKSYRCSDFSIVTIFFYISSDVGEKVNLMKDLVRELRNEMTV